MATGVPLSTSSWVQMGPNGIGGTSGFGGGNGGPASGRISGIAADPSDPNTIYVAATGGGVWKTTNGGTSWTPLTDNQSTLFMGSIAIAPSAPGTIYAGTGQGDNSADSYYGRGVLKSTDSGATWTLLGNSVFNRKSVVKVAIDPTNANNVYVAVATAVNGVGGSTGIWHSTNGGTTWSNTTSAIDSSDNWSDLVMDPLNPLVLYAAVGSAFGSGSNGVYKTTDGGATWAASGNFPNGVANGRISLAISTNVEGTIEASVENPATSGLLYLLQSTDNGATWTNTNAPNYLGGQGWYDNVVAISPLNSNVIFAGGVTNYSSTAPYYQIIESINGGSTWSDITVDPAGNQPHTDEHSTGFDSTGHLLIGGDGGIWRLNNSTPGASLSWQDINSNLDITQFVYGSLDAQNPDVLIAGSQDNGTAKFSNSTAWTQIWGGDGGYTAIDPTNDQTLYVTNTYISLYRSNAGGASGSYFYANGYPNAPYNTGDSTNFYTPFTLDPNNHLHILYGTYRLWSSTNQGASYSALTAAGANGWPAGTVAIKSIAIAPSNSNVIYVAKNDGSIYASSNGGTTWTTVTIPGWATAVNQVYVDPTTATTVYAVRSSFDGSSSGHVFKSTNSGVSWTDISGNLPDIPTNTVVVDSRTGINQLYVGTDTGVYVSSDGGVHWAAPQPGMPNVQITHLEYNTTFNTLMAVTYGRGVLELLTQATQPTGVTSSVSNTTLGANNTFTISVAFSYPVKLTGNPTLSLSDGGTATFLSISADKKTLNFTYTTLYGQTTSGAKLEATALNLNGATLLDGSNSPATLTLPTAGGTGSLSVNSGVIIDAVAPTVVHYNVLFGTAGVFDLTTSTRVRLPWMIRGIQVVFSKPVANANAASFTGIAAGAPTGLNSTTVTWLFTSAVFIGAFNTGLLGTGVNAVTDSLGNALTAGTGYSSSFKVLQGDINDDGVVNASDMILVGLAIGKPYNVFADIDGDGTNTVADVQFVRLRIGKKQA